MAEGRNFVIEQPSVNADLARLAASTSLRYIVAQRILWIRRSGDLQLLDACNEGMAAYGWKGGVDFHFDDYSTFLQLRIAKKIFYS